MLVLEPSWKSYLVLSTDPVFSIEECNQIIKVGKECEQIDGRIRASTKKGDVNRKIRRSKIAWLPFSKLNWMYNRLQHWMNTVNNKHMGFHQLQIGEMAQFTTYKKGDHYGWHADTSIHMAESPPVRKMSMGTLLNDPKEFKGGGIELLGGKKKVFLKQGYSVFFASFIGHQACPVTKGTRIAMVNWFGGPPLT